MLTVTGIFENERFIPDKPVHIPQNKKVVVTIEEEPVERTKIANKWREIGEAILNCDEELPSTRDNDILIAAYCIRLDLTLVTNNEKHFKHITKLKTANWVTYI